MTTPCTPTAPCANCADAERQEQRRREREAKPHDAACDYGYPCAMCVETAERGYEALAMAADPDYARHSHVHHFAEVQGQSVPECACGAVADYEDEPEWWKDEQARAMAFVATDVDSGRASSLIQPPDAARHSRNQQDYDADLQRRRCGKCEADGNCTCLQCGQRFCLSHAKCDDHDCTGSRRFDGDDLQRRRTANTEFDDDWLMAPSARKRGTQDDAFYYWWRGLQQGLALGVTQGNRDLQQMIEIAKERL